jgi:hypothetical protein
VSKTKDQIIAELRKEVQRLKQEVKRERVFEGDLINRWRIDSDADAEQIAGNWYTMFTRAYPSREHLARLKAAAFRLLALIEDQQYKHRHEDRDASGIETQHRAEHLAGSDDV